MRYVVTVLVSTTLLICPTIAYSRARMGTFYTSVTGCSLSPDRKLVALFFTSGGDAGGCGYSVSVLDADTGKELHSLNLGNSFSGSIPFLPDSRCLVVPTEPSVSLKTEDARKEKGQTLRIWDAVKGEDVRVFERPHEKDSEIYSIALSPDGKQAMAACRGGLGLWDVDTGKLLRTIDTGKAPPSEVIVFSPDAKRALAGCRVLAVGSTLTLWDMEQGKPIRSSPPGPVAKNTALSTWGCEIAFSPSGKWAATDRRIDYDNPRSTEYTLTIWDIATAKVVQELPCRAISSMFTPDGKQLRCGCYDKDENVCLKTLDVDTGKLVSSKVINKKPSFRTVSETYHMAFSPDGTRLVTVSGGTTSGYGAGDDLVIKLWDATTGKEIRTLHQPEKPQKPDASELERRGMVPQPRQDQGWTWRFWRNW